MNRITALLLGMAALLVHVLVLHRDGHGSFGPAFDSAHAAFRLARNFIHDGALAWWVDPATGEAAGGLRSYPSPLLVALASVFEYVGLSVTRGSQFVGVICALLTVAVSTRFDRDRIAGVVPALLLVSSGAVAAAGASGTEWPLAMALLVTSFVASEYGRNRIAACSIALLVIARPEGIPCALVLLIQSLLHRGKPVGSGPRLHPAAFVPAVATLGASVALDGALLDDLVRSLRFDGPTVGHGIAQLRDFLVSTASPLLLIFPLVALVLGELSGVGRRALGLMLTWVAFAVLGGGGPAPFDLAFVPALPIAFIAIQQGAARALDTYRRPMEQLVWIALGVGIFGSLLASRFPGDLGQIDLRRAQVRIYEARAASPPGHTELLARSSLHSELGQTVDLRRIGNFLRDRLPSDASILTPWPGAIGYLSRVHVIDLFGRTTAEIGGAYEPWSPDPGQLDLRAAMMLEPDYVLPSTGGLDALARGELVDGLPESLLALDPDDGPELRNQVGALLARYEIVVTTGQDVTRPVGDPTLWARPLVLLRKRGIQSAPRLTVVRTRDFVEVRAGLDPGEATTDVKRLPQVFDASIRIVTRAGTRTLVGPTGGALEGDAVGLSLEGFVVDPRWAVQVTLARIPNWLINGDDPAMRIEARLLHHRAPPAEPSSDATAPIVFPLR